MNSVVQFIAANKALCNHLVAKKPKGQVDDTEKRSAQLKTVDSLRKLLALMQMPAFWPPPSNMKLLESLNYLYDDKAIQHDALEFHHYIEDALNATGYKEVMQALTGGHTKSTLKCSLCNHEAHTCLAFSVINLTILKADSSVGSMINDNLEELVYDWKCEECKKVQDATKFTTIDGDDLPETFQFCLNRFGYQNHVPTKDVTKVKVDEFIYFTGRYQKLDPNPCPSQKPKVFKVPQLPRSVRLGSNETHNDVCEYAALMFLEDKEEKVVEGTPNLDHNSSSQSTFTYRLYSVLIHVGLEAKEGHYVLVARNKLSDRWFLYDDKKVDRFDPEDVRLLLSGELNLAAGLATPIMLAYHHHISNAASADVADGDGDDEENDDPSSDAGNDDDNGSTKGPENDDGNDAKDEDNDSSGGSSESPGNDDESSEYDEDNDAPCGSTGTRKNDDKDAVNVEDNDGPSLLKVVFDVTHADGVVASVLAPVEEVKEDVSFHLAGSQTEGGGEHKKRKQLAVHSNQNVENTVDLANSSDSEHSADLPPSSEGVVFTMGEEIFYLKLLWDRLDSKFKPKLDKHFSSLGFQAKVHHLYVVLYVADSYQPNEAVYLFLFYFFYFFFFFSFFFLN